ncbi:hypothetical protein VNO77_36517 [Canavalia gladiata]|uniref:Uncharacterized protein n=1 Tax=Canavalia gladiata TaxID=3824 RepID=A0AAN9K983_CANGL
MLHHRNHEPNKITFTENISPINYKSPPFQLCGSAEKSPNIKRLIYPPNGAKFVLIEQCQNRHFSFYVNKNPSPRYILSPLRYPSLCFASPHYTLKP